VYYPSGDVEREATFALVSGIGVYGGFKGNEVRKEQRDWLKNTTILSGEIGDQSVMTENVYHVVTGADEAILDDLVIRDGYADGISTIFEEQVFSAITRHHLRY